MDLFQIIRNIKAKNNYFYKITAITIPYSACRLCCLGYLIYKPCCLLLELFPLNNPKKYRTNKFE